MQGKKIKDIFEVHLLQAKSIRNQCQTCLIRDLYEIKTTHNIEEESNNIQKAIKKTTSMIKKKKLFFNVSMHACFQNNSLHKV